MQNSGGLADFKLLLAHKFNEFDSDLNEIEKYIKGHHIIVLGVTVIKLGRKHEGLIIPELLGHCFDVVLININISTCL